MLVTGAASGIGAASVALFAAEGATVIAADVQPVESSGAVEGVQLDVTDEAAVSTLIGRIVADHGRLDAAHNNAGISGMPVGFSDLAVDDWQRMIDVNLTSVFICMKHELRVMAEQGSGAIVNTSSGAGVVAAPGLPHYTAAKHGVVGLTKCGAQEYASRGVRVNAILPGSTRTPMIESFMAGNADIEKMIERSVGRGSLGAPDEVAQTAVWLCSDRASFVSGESMIVDGASICR